MEIKTTLKRVNILFVFLFSCFFLQSQPEIEWSQVFGGAEFERLVSIQPTSDGGYIMSGNTESNDGDVTNNNGSTDYWIVKTNSIGILEWEKNFGGSNFDSGAVLKETSDEGFIVTGSSRSTDGDVSANNGASDSWILKLDGDGLIEWEKNFGGSQLDGTVDILETSDGGFLAIGGTTSMDGDISTIKGSSDVLMIKLSASGEIIFIRTFGGSNPDNGISGLETTDGGFIFIGTTESNNGDVTNNNGSADYWIVKTNSMGILEWEQTYGGSDVDFVTSIISTEDQGYLVAGTSGSSDGDITNPKGQWDIWIIKLDENGNLLWEKSFGGSENDAVPSIYPAEDQGYIIAGASNSSDGDVSENFGIGDIWILKIDSNGNVLWQKSFGGSENEFARSIFLTADGGLIIGGDSKSSDGDVGENNGDYDYWVFKLSPLTSTTNETPLVANFNISPNPNNGQFLIETSNATHPITIQIANGVGQIIYKDQTGTSMVDLSKYPKGQYWVTIIENGLPVTKSFIIE